MLNIIVSSIPIISGNQLDEWDIRDFPERVPDENRDNSTYQIVIKLDLPDDQFTVPDELIETFDENNCSGLYYEAYLISIGKIITAKFPASVDNETLIGQLQAFSEVEYVAPFVYYESGVYPDDPQIGSQWALDKAQFPTAWDTTTGSDQVTVAVIDTGIDLDHEDLAANIWANPVEVEGDLNGDGYPGVRDVDDDGDGLVDEDGQGRQPWENGYDWSYAADDDENGYIDDYNGWDFIDNDNIPEDLNGHGTHVAGIVGAVGNNGVGVSGGAWNVKLLPLKAAQSSGTVGIVEAANAVIYAYEQDADVIVMSFSGPSHPLLQDALELAYNKAILVAAAGNDGKKIYPQPGGFIDLKKRGAVNYPASYSFVIGVGASDSEDYAASFSNTVCADVFAPGAGILSSLPNNKYASWSGTSMSAPYVGAVAALMKSKHLGDDTWTNTIITSQILNGANLEPVFDKVTSDVIGSQINTNKILAAPFPSPAVGMKSYEIIDTNGDNDGVADAGETVDIVLSLRNMGGNSFSTSAQLTSEDPLIGIINGLADFGGIGATNFDDNHDNPFTIQISSEAGNNRDIVFSVDLTSIDLFDAEIHTGGSFTITVQKGFEVGGIIDQDTTWTSDRIYIVTEPILVWENTKLTIEPGTRIQFDPGTYLQVEGIIEAIGTDHDPIVFTSNLLNPNQCSWYREPDRISIDIGNAGSTLQYIVMEYGASISALNADISNSIFRFNGKGGEATSDTTFGFYYCNVQSNIFKENNFHYSPLITGSGTFTGNSVEKNYGDCRYPLLEFYGLILNNNIFGNTNSLGSILGWGVARFGTSLNNIGMDYWDLAFSILPSYKNNNILNLDSAYELTFSDYSYINSNDVLLDATENFWGVSLTDEMDEKGASADISRFWDFNDDFNHRNSYVLYDNWLQTPNQDAPPFLYKIIVNPNPVTQGGATFDLHFSKPMTQEIDPYVFFGPTEPYTHWQIPGEWVSDTVWQGTFTINQFTGDGLNTIKVWGAKDLDGFEIPEDTITQFEIITIGTSSSELHASGEVGQISLDWPPAEDDTLAGFNLYRKGPGEPELSIINEYIILDSDYIDTNVLPGEVYEYVYTVVQSDLTESEPSEIASASPVDTIPPVIVHTPVTASNPNIPVTIIAQVTDNVAIPTANLYYRLVGTNEYTIVEMVNPVDSQYSANIPAEQVQLGTSIEYYIEASDHMNTVTDGTAETPYTVQISDLESPVPLFTVPSKVRVGEQIQLSGSNSYDNIEITSYDWSFGDTVTGLGETVAHSYAIPGLYDVMLTVTDNAENTGALTRQVKVYSEYNLHFEQTGYYSDISFGQGPSATTEFDELYDASAVPLPPEGLTAYVWHPGNPTTPIETRMLSTSITSNEYPVTYDVIIETTNTEDQVTATWTLDDYTSIPEMYSILLIDPNAGTTLDMKETNSYTFTPDTEEYALQVQITPETSITYSLEPGWSLISIPLILEDNLVSSVFSSLPYYQLVEWDGESYVTPEAIQPGAGYWILVMVETEVTVTGIPIQTMSYVFNPGWNLIGGPYQTVPVESITDSYYQIVSWDGYGYVNELELTPGNGYWLLVLTETSVTLP